MFRRRFLTPILPSVYDARANRHESEILFSVLIRSQGDSLLQSTEITWRARVSQPAPPPVGMPRLIWEILAARGYDTQNKTQGFLSPSLKGLRDPFTLTDMNAAIARLLKAFDSGEKICIYCDYDLDGTSACAMLLQAFAQFGFSNFSHYQPKRLTEGYGLHKDAIQRIAAQGVTLILTADLGITANEEVDYAAELGVDVIVTDHHLPKESLPRAVAVVNPNRGNCEANLGHLCGTGVAFYLILALKRALQERGLLGTDFDPKSLLDCFVIGTLTDMVPLIDENRVLVKHGLLQLARSQRPGLRALLQALNLWGQPLTSQDVAIRFAPKLNALSRMEMGIQPLDIYIAPDEKAAERLVAEVLSNNQLRQASQREAEAEAFRQMAERPPKACCFVWSREFHKGVVGLVATKLAEEFGRPAFVGSVDEMGRVIGSARMPDGIELNLLDALAANHEIVTKFGGHAMACGFEVDETKAPELAAGLDRWFSENLAEARRPEWVYDAEAELSEFNPAFMQWYEHLGPFGVGFEAPVFLIRSARLTQVQPLKGGHLRLTLGGSGASGSTNALESRSAIWFSPPKGHPVSESMLRPGVRVDVLAEPQWNYFGGRKSIQLLIQDLRLSCDI